MVFTIKKRMEVYFTKTRFVLDLQPAASANCPRTILFISLRAYDKTLEDWIGLMPLTVLGYVALMKNTEFERYCKNFCLPQLYFDMTDSQIYPHIIYIMEQDEEVNENQ